MTPEEIKKIAYYISEKRHNEEEASDSTTFLFPIDIYVDIVTKLSERYCIVPKEQVYMRLGVANALMEQDPARKEFYRGMSSAIVSIFGKDMFEEEGK